MLGFAGGICAGCSMRCIAQSGVVKLVMPTGMAGQVSGIEDQMLAYRGTQGVPVGLMDEALCGVPLRVSGDVVSWVLQLALETLRGCASDLGGIMLVLDR